MKPGPLTSREPVHPAIAAGAVLFCVGIVAWVWLADWRYAATGLVVLVLSSIVAATRTSR